MPENSSDASGELEQERKARLEELEARLERPSAVGVTPVLAAVVLVATLYLCLRQWPDAAYFWSSPEPVDLGVEGDYHFERLASNTYVQLHGAPTSRASYGRDGQLTVVVVGVRDTKLLLARPALATEDWLAGKPPPPPDPRSFSVRGRLLSKVDASARWADAFEKHQGFGELTPEWLVVESERPRQSVAAIGWFGVLAAFAALNAWLLLRGLRALLARLGRPETTKPTPD